MACYVRITTTASVTARTVSTATAGANVSLLNPVHIHLVPTAHVSLFFSRFKGPPPRKRPHLKTKYTNYPQTDPTTADTTTSEGGSETGQGAAKEITEESTVKDNKEKNFAAAVFNFYGANEGASTNTGTGKGSGKTCGKNKMQIEAVCEGTEAAVELPSYAPEVCVEAGMGVEVETEVLMAECSENEVNRGQTGPVQTETADETIAVETKPHPPAHEECIDVTEEDIFGSSDEDMETCGECVQQWTIMGASDLVLSPFR